MKTSHSYFVVMQDFGHLGLEATVQPERTRRCIVELIASGEFRDIEFIHFIADGVVEDVTEELLDAAEAIALQAAE